MTSPHPVQVVPQLDQMIDDRVESVTFDHDMSQSGIVDRAADLEKGLVVVSLDDKGGAVPLADVGLAASAVPSLIVAHPLCSGFGENPSVRATDPRVCRDRAEPILYEPNAWDEAIRVIGWMLVAIFVGAVILRGVL